LNLRLDRYRYEYTPGGASGASTAGIVLRCSARGSTPVPRAARPPEIAARRGIDLHPVDPRDPEAVRWLRALVWPEHAERAALLLEALAAAARDPAPVELGDALDVLPRVAAQMPSEAVLVVSHSATLAHMPLEGRLRFAEALEEVAAERRVLWLPLESDRSFAPPLAELIDLRAPGPPDGFVLGLADLAPHRRPVGRVLAHAQWHGAWIEWREAP